MRIKIRDWDEHFERDRTRQWKRLDWFPCPNKQGTGYRKIMKQQRGCEIYASWMALLAIASTCTPRGDLSKYSPDDLSELSLINQDTLIMSIDFLSQVLDWVEVIENEIENLDINVNNLDIDGQHSLTFSSILFDSVQSSSIPFSSGTKMKNVSSRKTVDRSGVTDSREVKATENVATWRTSYEVFLSEHDKAYEGLIKNENWIAKLKYLNPDLDIMLSLENAREYWRTDEGWKHKKIKRVDDLNWESTYRKAVRQPMNRVFEKKPRYGAREVSKTDIQSSLSFLKDLK